MDRHDRIGRGLDRAGELSGKLGEHAGTAGGPRGLRCWHVLMSRMRECTFVYWRCLHHRTNGGGRLSGDEAIPLTPAHDRADRCRQTTHCDREGHEGSEETKQTGPSRSSRPSRLIRSAAMTAPENRAPGRLGPPKVLTLMNA